MTIAVHIPQPRSVFLRRFLQSTAVLALLGGSAGAQEIIDNGVIQLGINPFGELITNGIGLTFLPTSGESLAPGCACEGWGLADLGVGTGFGRSQSNGNSGTGTAALTVSGTGTNPLSTGSAATSTVDITEGGLDFARVIHAYRPSSNVNLYQVDVTISNIGGLPITNLVYRRAMDWDTPPTEFNEFVTLQGWPAAALVGSSDDGFADPNPNSGALTDTAGAPVNANFSDDGPADHGAAFDFSFGSLAPGANQTFTIYYGAAGTVDAALAALGSVGAEVYSLGYPNDGSGGPNPTGAPNVFIFAFAGVGGTPVGGASGRQAEAELLRSLGVMVAQNVLTDPLLRMSGNVHGGESANAVQAGLRFIATGGVTGSSFETVDGFDAEMDFAHGGLVAEYVFEGGSLIGPRVGMGLDFGRANGELANNGPTADMSATTLYMYGGTSFANGAYIDGSLGYTWLGYDTLRARGLGDFAGDFNGGQFAGMIRAGIDRPIAVGKLPGDLTIGGFGSLLFSSTDIDGFTETSATLPAGAVTVGEQDVGSFTSRLGLRLNYSGTTDGGVTFSGSTWVAWEHQSIGGGELNATTGGGAASFTVADVNRDIAVIGLRAGAQIAQNVTISGEYEGGFGSGYESHTLEGKLKVKW